MRIKSFALVTTIAAFGLSPAFAGSCGSHDKTAVQASTPGSADIVETAVANGSFTTLVAAVEAAGLVETLSAEGPFTVFAPTDEAFAKLPDGTVESLLASPDKLRAILLYHVVPGSVDSSQVATLDSATTAQGSDVRIRVADGSVMVNDSKVIAADIETSNGLIHVVDTVILPAG